MKYFFSWCNCPVNNQHLKVKKTSLWSKHIKGSKEHLFIRTTTQYANFRGNPLCQAPKFHLNDSETVKKNDEKWDEKRNNLSFMLSYVIFLSSVWKNVPYLCLALNVQTSQARSTSVADVYVASWASLFLLFIGKEQSNMSVHPEELGFKETSTCVAWVLTEQPCKAFWVCC